MMKFKTLAVIKLVLSLVIWEYFGYIISTPILILIGGCFWRVRKTPTARASARSVWPACPNTTTGCGGQQSLLLSYLQSGIHPTMWGRQYLHEVEPQ